MKKILNKVLVTIRRDKKRDSPNQKVKNKTKTTNKEETKTAITHSTFKNSYNSTTQNPIPKDSS